MKIDTEETAKLYAKLAAPFEASEVKFKPQSFNKEKTKAMACAYIDARLVMDRLDECVGVSNWQDKYTLMDGGNVMCSLTVRLGDEWITKTDVGGPSEQPDDGDKCKAAFSDALKRAAVKFGIGRYLYRFPQQWLGWDAQKRRFTETPKIPAAYAPKPAPSRQISDTELKALEKLISETGSDPQKFCDHFQIDDLEYIPARQYSQAIAMLNKKLDQMRNGTPIPAR